MGVWQYDLVRGERRSYVSIERSGGSRPFQNNQSTNKNGDATKAPPLSYVFQGLR